MEGLEDRAKSLLLSVGVNQKKNDRPAFIIAHEGYGPGQAVCIIEFDDEKKVTRVSAKEAN